MCERHVLTRPKLAGADPLATLRYRIVSGSHSPGPTRGYTILGWVWADDWAFTCASSREKLCGRTACSTGPPSSTLPLSMVSLMETFRAEIFFSDYLHAFRWIPYNGSFKIVRTLPFNSWMGQTLDGLYVSRSKYELSRTWHSSKRAHIIIYQKKKISDVLLAGCKIFDSLTFIQKKFLLLGGHSKFHTDRMIGSQQVKKRHFAR